jgi:hypothetical protein
VINSIFKHKKVRYKGLVKNDALRSRLFALGNLTMRRGEQRP